MTKFLVVNYGLNINFKFIPTISGPNDLLSLQNMNRDNRRESESNTVAHFKTYP